jgi:hypothetical protein
MGTRPNQWSVSIRAGQVHGDDSTVLLWSAYAENLYTDAQKS